MATLTETRPLLETSDPRDALGVEREWLVTNGLGGYACGTISGVPTRRYHGFLIAAHPAGRMMLLNGAVERVRLPDGRVAFLGPEALAEVPGHMVVSGTFRLEWGLPIWTFDVFGHIIEKRLVLSYRQNTVHVRYWLLSGSGPIRLGVRPLLHFRPHDSPVTVAIEPDYQLQMSRGRLEICSDAVPGIALRFAFEAPSSAFTVDGKTVRSIRFPIEEERGYEAVGSTWSPGYYRADLRPGESASLMASTESWDAMLALAGEQAIAVETQRRHALVAAARPAARTGLGPSLVLAADQFLITPGGRHGDSARARAEGEEAWTVIAGYHWFTDWGRDTMISLEGLTQPTGRLAEARWILRTFAHYVRRGLIPNLFPEGNHEGLYHTADASLWFFHALHRYLAASGDVDTLRVILPRLLEIADAHLAGTDFGIHVDPEDGLLSQGQEGYQLTWMDAKVGDWVVTPRRGKAVEINALWYNALCLLEQWLTETRHERAGAYTPHLERARASFNRRFWNPAANFLYDVVDGIPGADGKGAGDDPACRPNQILALSLDHPVLDRAYWDPVVAAVTERLLTPYGLRSLDPAHPDYKPVYFGDLRARDAAYHQGTVWSWLIGPYIDARRKVTPAGEDQAIREYLSGFARHLDQACVGSISEIFDGDSPWVPRGCVSQAWSVAEVLRCWVALAPPPDATIVA